MLYLMKSKSTIFFNTKVTQIEHSAFFGTPDIHQLTLYTSISTNTQMNGKHKTVFDNKQKLLLYT